LIGSQYFHTTQNRPSIPDTSTVSKILIYQCLPKYWYPVNQKKVCCVTQRSKWGTKMTDQKRYKGVTLVKTIRSSKPLAEGACTRCSATTPRSTFSVTYGNEVLTHMPRELIFCTILVALNREREQAMHFVGAKNLGILRTKIEAMIIHPRTRLVSPAVPQQVVC
jgi:hypothetical protein